MTKPKTQRRKTMPDGQIKPMERLPILWIAMGRQRVGKTALLNTAVQFFQASGNPIRIWNADQQNRSHTLSVFFPDAEEVPNGGIEDGKSWIEGRIEDLIKHRYNAVLDVGGGATGFARLIQEVPLLEAIEGSAVRVVGLSASDRRRRTWITWSNSPRWTCSCRRHP
jgi:hypothetical protein